MSGMPMKLILTQEVTGLGAPGDVVEVAGGYGATTWCRAGSPCAGPAGRRSRSS